MRRLGVFNQVSLDGYFTDAHGDMSWAHRSDPEWVAWTESNARRGGTLLFGRVTYDMMAAWWPTAAAAEAMPEVAAAMNQLPKIVFSRTLARASWQNTRVEQRDPALAVRELKREDEGNDMVILGSGTVVAQLAQAGLVDEYQVVVNPIVLGAGRTMFDGVRTRIALELTAERRFANGNVVLTYRPRKS